MLSIRSQNFIRNFGSEIKFFMRGKSKKFSLNWISNFVSPQAARRWNFFWPSRQSFGRRCCATRSRRSGRGRHRPRIERQPTAARTFTTRTSTRRPEEFEFRLRTTTEGEDPNSSQSVELPANVRRIQIHPFESSRSVCLCKSFDKTLKCFPASLRIKLKLRHRKYSVENSLRTLPKRRVN